MSDYDETAKIALIDIQHDLHAIAAALIALVEQRQSAELVPAVVEEQRPQFVEVGAHTFDANQIAAIWTDKDVVHIWLSANKGVSLFGDDARAFLHWWSQHANVTRLDEPERHGPDWDECAAEEG